MGTYSEVMIKLDRKAFEEVFLPRKEELMLQNWKVLKDEKHLYIYRFDKVV